ncbi:YbhB/YbcL family Raf kinase inhibitor-like protein [Deinococcus yavapaiensis]|uniref:PBP family phospholipid-binding protein n=1 Tax=Deinococcus yavapaiensis KR-236 TaxID=694435 RepID=A0A318SQQ3_9DEIO|nr:YbhB/YbcL family Raf kinase inhibitor-like protein [Deinococcus yavapaiensis]PYE55203.1 PBP family phospholipid-binding protein [Deinococcus yavapaiensis KR-236]
MSNALTHRVLPAATLAALLSACAPTLTLGGNPAGARLSVAQPGGTVSAGTLTLSSPQFANGGRIANEQSANVFGCTGGNVSPTLTWSGAPAGTQSFALTMYDPDAPTGSGFWHWIVYNIPATATSLSLGAGAASGTALPAGTRQGAGDAGTVGYLGPCPSVGDPPHRYVFTLYALNRTLDIPANSAPAIVGFNLDGSTIARTTLTGFFGR